MKDAVVSKAAIAAVEMLRPPGYLDAIRASATRETETHYVIPRDKYTALCKVFQSNKVSEKVPTHGPGTEMKALLARIGIVSSPTCSCNKRAKIMDEKGCDWCEEHIDEIDGWLAEEAKKRKLPYLSIAGRALIHLAIRRARKKTQTPT